MKEFITKNLAKIVLIGVIAILMFFIYNRQSRLIVAESRLASLQTKFENIQNDRDILETEFNGLYATNKKLKKEIDSIKVVQDKDNKYFEYVISKHKAEIDSLLDIPNDTVYSRLQPIYPNPEHNPLLYPFSGNQIRQIYSTAISYPRLQYEYSLQSKILEDCETLNKKYELSEENYKVQVENLTTSIDMCDSQIALKEDQLSITRKQIKNKSFWNWTYKGLVIAMGAIIIAK